MLIIKDLLQRNQEPAPIRSFGSGGGTISVQPVDWSTTQASRELK